MAGLICILALTFLMGLKPESVNGSQRTRENYVGAVFAMLILFALLRGYEVAIDYSNRVEHMYHLFSRNFSNMLKFTLDSMGWEYLYTIPIWLISRVIPSPWLMNSIMDCFVLVTFGWFICRYSRDVTMTCLLFVALVFPASLNVTRQYIAAALFLIALHYLFQKRPWVALIPLVIAVFIHNSAILLFAVYLLYHFGFQLTKRRLVLYLAVLATVVVFYDLALAVFLKVFPQYAYALREEFAGGGMISLNWILFALAMWAALWFITPPRNGLADGSPQEKRQADITGFVGLSFILYAAIGVLRAKMWVVNRIQVYFIVGFCMVFSEILAEVGKSVSYYPRLRPLQKKLEQWQFETKIKPILTAALKCLFMAWGVLQYINDPHGLFPYTFVWQ